MKKFFSSPWFKCITVLLVILLVCGGVLAVLNDVLYVSPEMRTSRAIKKIYGEEKEYSVVFESTDETPALRYEYEDGSGMGQINKVYEVGEGDSYDILIQSTGFNGYKNGTVTLWIQVNFNGSQYDIVKVILESYEKQTLMSKLSSDYYEKFCLSDVTEAFKNEELFTSEDKSSENYNPVSGATKSSRAGCNAVNCVIEYIGGLQK